MTNRIPSYLEYVKTITITSAGSGYNTPVTLLIDAPTGDNPIQAVATATIDFAGSGNITAITITEGGDGYSLTPSIKVSGGATTVTDTSETSTGLDAGTYTGVSPSSTSGQGQFGTFDIVINGLGNVTSITPNNGGDSYVQDDTITFLPTVLGGTGSEKNVTGTISHINGGQGGLLTSEIDIIAKADVYSQPKIAKLVGQQLPEFIRDDHILFQTFIEKYFEFLEETNTTDSTKHGPLKVLQDFLAKLDVDFNDDGSINTDDNFLKEFYKDYVKDLPLGQTAKLSLVLKHINDFYTAKGSVEAIKLLFRILYNEEVTLFNAQEFVLRPSSSKWQQDYVVKVYERKTYINSSTDDYDPADFVGQQVDLHYYESTGSVTNSSTKRASVQSVKKIAYTNPQAYELVLSGVDNTFSLPGPGAGSLSSDEMLQPEVAGDIGTITGTAGGGAYNTPDPSVVDGTYSITDSDFTAYIDIDYDNSITITKGQYVKANSKIYLAINTGTTNGVGTGPNHESGDATDGNVKFRFIEITSATGHYSSGSSGATFTVVIAGNAVSSVTMTDNGTDYYPNEILEIPATKFGGTGTGVKIKVATITNGKIKKALIIDGGTGYAANPQIIVTKNSTDTITTEALLETRTTNGTIDQILFTNNQQGVGYNNLPDIRISTGLTLTFVSLAGEVFPDSTSGDTFSAMKGIVTRVLNTAKFNSIKSGSSTTAGGFKIGDSYVINETGGVLGVYATDYFLEDYTLTGVSNNAYVRVTSLDAVGYPATFEVLAVGQGFNRQTFQIELESPTGEVALVDFTTGYNAVLGGVAGDSGGFLSDANKLFDNLVYQPFAYQIQSELQASEWKEYVKRSAHPAGFALYGDLQIKQDIDFSAGFTVETDVYMFFVYPDIEEILVQETVVKDITMAEAGPDSIFPGDAINTFDVTTAPSDSVGVADEEGPYTFVGTSVAVFYATSDGTETGDPYFVQHGTASDDYVERFGIGDYFLNDGGPYVELGNPQKLVEMNFNSTDTGEYALDYFANDSGRYTVLIADDAERSTEFFFANDVLTSLAVETTFTDDAQMSESVLISFVFFRTPSDTFDTADSVVVEAQPRPTDTFDIADAVNKFDIGVNPTDTSLAQDGVTLKEVTTVRADTFTSDDTISIEPQLIGTDTTQMQDSTSLEHGGVYTDTFNIADAVTKFDIGVNPSDTGATADSINNFDITTAPADTSNTADSLTSLNIEIDLTGSSVDEDVAVGDSGSAISQSYTVDLTYFAEDYVADSVVSF
tara:strand:- start:449 stop:4249 length:3801 start_codon:yes stop_codon:yes gene_type:complete